MGLPHCVVLRAGSQQHDDYANVIAAPVIHADSHLTDVERGPLPRRARTCRGLRPPAGELRYH